LGKAPVSGAIAQQALPRVTMGVDKAGEHNRALRVDFARVDCTEIGLYRRDLRAVDQNVRVQMLPDLCIHGEHNCIANDRTVHRNASSQLLLSGDAKRACNPKV
jgi:hypothetical protein